MQFFPQFKSINLCTKQIKIKTNNFIYEIWQFSVLNEASDTLFWIGHYNDIYLLHSQIVKNILRHFIFRSKWNSFDFPFFRIKTFHKRLTRSCVHSRLMNGNKWKNGLEWISHFFMKIVGPAEIEIATPISFLKSHTRTHTDTHTETHTYRHIDTQTDTHIDTHRHAFWKKISGKIKFWKR